MASPTPIVTSALVNYTNLPTQASNQVYVVETDSSDSTASLIRNNLFLEIALPVLNVEDISSETDTPES
jgi:hypothetical protein